MHAITVSTKKMIALATAFVVAVTVLLFLVQSDASATTACTAAAFTDGSGNFDLEGYLACLSGALPSTGSSNNLQIVGIALGAAAIGAGLLFVSARSRRQSA